MILFAYMGEIDIPQTIIVIKCNEKFSISDRDITGHNLIPLVKVYLKKL